MMFTRRALAKLFTALPFGARALPAALPYDQIQKTYQAHSRKRYPIPPTLWYENEAGERWIPTLEELWDPPPAGYVYQRSRRPNVLHESVVKLPEPRKTIAQGGGGWTITSEFGWHEDLVFAMANDGYSLGAAILITANLCERCMNAAAHDYHLGWGYPRYSEAWRRSNTTCEFCK